jgi:hypothetical protein
VFQATPLLVELQFVRVPVEEVIEEIFQLDSQELEPELSNTYKKDSRHKS